MKNDIYFFPDYDHILVVQIYTVAFIFLKW